MAILERTYTIPLRREWLKSPRYRRAKKAVTAVKVFLIKHMKSDDIKIGKYLNEMIWKHGIKNPPCRIKVNVQKDDQNTVRVELFGKKIDTGEKKEVQEQGIAAKMVEKITGKKSVVRPKKEKKEAKKELPKAEEEVKKEMPKSEEVKESNPKEETMQKPVSASPRTSSETKPAVKEEAKKETSEAEVTEAKQKPVSAKPKEEAKPEVRQKPAEK